MLYEKQQYIKKINHITIYPLYLSGDRGPKQRLYAFSRIIIGELLPVSFLSRQTRVCHDWTRLLSRERYACLHKTFVTTKLCLSRQNIWSWQTFGRGKCHDKHTFVTRKDVFCRDKHVSRDKSKLVVTKWFVATKICLLRPKTDFLIK